MICHSKRFIFYSDCRLSFASWMVSGMAGCAMALAAIFLTAVRADAAPPMVATQSDAARDHIQHIQFTGTISAPA